MQYKDTSPIEVGDGVKSSLFRRSSKKMVYTLLILILLIIILSLVIYFVTKIDEPSGAPFKATVFEENFTIINQVTIIAGKENETRTAMLFEEKDIARVANILERSRWHSTGVRKPTTGTGKQTGDEAERDGNSSAIALQLVQYIGDENHTAGSVEWILVPQNITETPASDLYIGTMETEDKNDTAAENMYGDRPLNASYIRDENHTTESVEWILVPQNITETAASDLYIGTMETEDKNGTAAEKMYGDRPLNASYIRDENHTAGGVEWILVPQNITETAGSELYSSTTETENENNTAEVTNGDRPLNVSYIGDENHTTESVEWIQVPQNMSELYVGTMDSESENNTTAEAMHSDRPLNASIENFENEIGLSLQPTPLERENDTAATGSDDQVPVTDQPTEKVTGNDITEVDSTSGVTGSHGPSQVEDAALNRTISESPAQQQQHNSTEPNGNASGSENTSVKSRLSHFFTNAWNKTQSVLKLPYSLLVLLTS